MSMAGKGSGRGRGRGRKETESPSSVKKVTKSRSSKAGLRFPVGRIARFLKTEKYADRISAGAPVYLAAVLEYLAAEVVFELDRNVTKKNKKMRISPSHIQLALRIDIELFKIKKNATISNNEHGTARPITRSQSKKINGPITRSMMKTLP